MSYLKQFSYEINIKCNDTEMVILYEDLGYNNEKRNYYPIKLQLDSNLLYSRSNTRKILMKKVKW